MREDAYLFGSAIGGIWHEVISSTVGQYTGLTDKNGKSVYDADVVRIDGGRICAVYWFSSPSYCGWDLKALNVRGNPPDASTLWGNLEVIGNIYDNQDLLSIYQEGNEC